MTPHMKRNSIRLAIASLTVSASLLGLTGIGFIDDLLGGSSAQRGGTVWCC